MIFKFYLIINDSLCLAYWKVTQLLNSLYIHLDGIILCNVNMQMEMTKFFVIKLGYCAHLLLVLLNPLYTLSIIICNVL